MRPSVRFHLAVKNLHLVNRQKPVRALSSPDALVKDACILSCLQQPVNISKKTGDTTHLRRTIK
jgi:hypothetical protein